MEDGTGETDARIRKFRLLVRKKINNMHQTKPGKTYRSKKRVNVDVASNE